jgi:hypothetical protein
MLLRPLEQQSNVEYQLIVPTNPSTTKQGAINQKCSRNSGTEWSWHLSKARNHPQHCTPQCNTAKQCGKHFVAPNLGKRLRAARNVVADDLQSMEILALPSSIRIPQITRSSLCRHSSDSRVPNPHRAIPPSTQPSRPQVGSTICASSPTHRTRGHPRQGGAARYISARTDKQDYRKQERWTLGFRDLTTEEMSAEHSTSARDWGRRGLPPTGRPAADG